MGDYFKKNHREVELVSLLFSHNQESKDIYIRKTSGIRDFYELVYPREILINSYKQKFTKKEYNKFIETFVSKVSILLKEIKPDLVFLNGFSLSNWVIMQAAHQSGIPSCIQHAGLWKKELIASGSSFSPSIKKIFSSYEKEAFKKTAHQIILNDFSRDELFEIHNVSKKEFLKKTSIIPLPIEIDKPKKVSLIAPKVFQIGVVARWDRIKNHSAVYRLAKYIKDNNFNCRINVVTKWDPSYKTNFKDKYQNIVNIIPPMSPKELKNFYKDQDIVLIPSRFDVSPTVLMEALLLGKPVVISNKVGWVTDYKKFEIHELVFNFTDSGEKIFKKIEKLLSSKDKYLPQFTLLQNKIINEHSNKKVFDQYYKLFKIIKNA
jgi:glycosyltransferase involved in cell wall biosynthesis